MRKINADEIVIEIHIILPNASKVTAVFYQGVTNCVYEYLSLSDLDLAISHLCLENLLLIRSFFQGPGSGASFLLCLVLAHIFELSFFFPGEVL